MNDSINQMAVAARPCAGTGKMQRMKKKARELAERGMATAEYAVGILAAVALALVLLKVFNAGGFLDTIMKLVTSIFDKVLGWLP